MSEIREVGLYMPKATSANGNADSTEVAKRNVFDSESLRNIESFEDAFALMQEAGVEVEDAADAIGDGFTLVDDKSRLCGIPLAFLTWSFSKSDEGMGEYAVARVVAKMDNGTVGKFVVVDGGTGIYEQLRQYSEARGGKVGGLTTMGGLRRSDYEVELENPKTGKVEKSRATTYYIDTAKK